MVSLCAILLATLSPITVEMSPCGAQTFTNVPSRLFVSDANYLDMVWALGHDGDVIANGPESGLAITNYFAELPGYRTAFAHPKRRCPTRGAGRLLFDREFFYSLGTDILHLDPLMLRASRLSAADLADVTRVAGPFFANRFSRDDSPVAGHPDYRYYTILELTEKMAEVYREGDRFVRLAAFVRTVESNVVRRLPPLEARPRVGLIFYNAAGNSGRVLPFWIRGGFGQAHYRLLGVKDAFAGLKVGFYGSRGANSAGMDLEGLLAVDPDVLIMPFAHVALMSGDSQNGQAAAFRQLAALKTHPVGRHLKAVREGRVYAGGTPLQGPVTYLFQLELAARQIYPDLFPENQPLFSRSQLAEVFRCAHEAENLL